jgi:hypothetical protein
MKLGILFQENSALALSVIPAKAGIQWSPNVLDSGFRRSDVHSEKP